MSISSEIERIQTAKSAIITSIENKGVTVPTGAMIDELPELIDSIPSGGGGGMYGTEIIGNKAYKTVKMPDGKTWLAENLNYKFSGGTFNPDGYTTTPAYWFYNGGTVEPVEFYGLLYNGYAAQYLENNKETLIPGWRLPTESDYSNLISLFPNQNAAFKSLCAFDTATNDTGFSIINAGRRENNGNYTDAGGADVWTLAAPGNRQCLFSKWGTVRIESYDRAFAYGIRLIKE